jgi:hypothetical protein
MRIQKTPTWGKTKTKTTLSEMGIDPVSYFGGDLDAIGQDVTRL